MGGWGYFDDENDDAADTFCDLLNYLGELEGEAECGGLEDAIAARSGASLEDADIFTRNYPAIYAFVKKHLMEDGVTMCWTHPTWASRAAFTLGVLLRVVRELTGVPCGWFVHENPTHLPEGFDPQLKRMGAYFAQFLDPRSKGAHNPNIPTTREEAVRITQELFGPPEHPTGMEDIVEYITNRIGAPPS